MPCCCTDTSPRPYDKSFPSASCYCRDYRDDSLASDSIPFLREEIMSLKGLDSTPKTKAPMESESEPEPATSRPPPCYSRVKGCWKETCQAEMAENVKYNPNELNYISSISYDLPKGRNFTWTVSVWRNEYYLNKVFPPKSLTVLDTLANIGLLFFMYLVGL